MHLCERQTPKISFVAFATLEMGKKNWYERMKDVNLLREQKRLI